MGSRAPSHLIRRVARVPATDQFTTSVNLGELLYGAYRRNRDDLVAKIKEVAQNVNAVLPFDEHAADVYASVRATLERQGRKLPEPDLRIAAVALRRDFTVVTGNVRHFHRIPGLRVENWLEP